MEEKHFKNSKLNIAFTLCDFSQRQYEAYQQELIHGDPRTNAAKNGAVVRSAIKAEFLKGIEIESIPDMSPAAVAWATIRIHQHVVRVTTPPAEDDPDIKN